MENMTWVGIDVSARTLTGATADRLGGVQEWTETNDAAGHQRLVRQLTRGDGLVRVCLEATGIYHFDLALVLATAPGIAVMVANPRATKAFGQATVQRAKTDRVDARLLLAFAQRMPWRPWRAPSEAVIALRALTRRISALIRTRVEEQMRLHTTGASTALPAALGAASRAHMAFLDASIRDLTAAATAVVDGDATLRRQLALLCSIPGIGTRSGLRLLAELAVLPADMTVRQWVAHAGLDPRPFQSGTSVHRPARISRTGNAGLRAALYMPALVAIRYDASVAAFAARLRARGHKPKQAIAAVMRKRLHAIHGMLRHDQAYDSTKCHRAVA